MSRGAKTARAEEPHAQAIEEVRRVFPTHPTRAFGMGRAVLERTVVLIPDVEVDPEYQQQALGRAIGWRSGLFVPISNLLSNALKFTPEGAGLTSAPGRMTRSPRCP